MIPYRGELGAVVQRGLQMAALAVPRLESVPCDRRVAIQQLFAAPWPPPVH